MLGPDPFPGRCGLAQTDPTELGRAVVGAWDAFLAVAGDPATDLSAASRLPGWSGRDTCIHMGSWDDHVVLVGLLEAARTGGGPESPDAHAVDSGNAALVASHRDATNAEVIEALQRSRDALAHFFADVPAELTRARVRSSVGELPLLSLIHAGCYELAVHALDLGPCGAPAPSALLLDRGLAALLDVTGALSARQDIDITVTAQTDAGGWSFTSDAQGWNTNPVAPGRFDGVGVTAAPSTLLEASSGRAALPVLLLSRKLSVQNLTGFMRLSPLLSEVPGLPGGAALRAGVGGLSTVTGGVSKLLSRLRR